MLVSIVQRRHNILAQWRGYQRDPPRPIPEVRGRVRPLESRLPPVLLRRYAFGVYVRSLVLSFNLPRRMVAYCLRS